MSWTPTTTSWLLRRRSVSNPKPAKTYLPSRRNNQERHSAIFSFASARLIHTHVRHRGKQQSQSNGHGQDEIQRGIERQTHRQEDRCQDEAALAAEGSEHQE